MYNTTAYFVEMNLLQHDKLRRIKTADKFSKEIMRFLRNQLLALMSGVFMHEKTSTDYREELMDLYIAMAESYDHEVLEKAHRFSGYIQEATERAVYKAKGNQEYQTAIQLGIRVKEEDIPKSVLRMFTDERANEIALNETNWIYNYLNHKQLAETQATHTWESMRDERVRNSHIKADGQTVPINEPFIVGGYKMMFPLDDSMGAPISEIIGCRCVEL